MHVCLHDAARRWRGSQDDDPSGGRPASVTSCALHLNILIQTAHTQALVLVYILYNAESQKSKGATTGHYPDFSCRPQFPVLMDCKSRVFTVCRVNRGLYCGVGRSYLIPGVFATLHAYDEETTCWCLWLGEAGDLHTTTTQKLTGSGSGSAPSGSSLSPPEFF